MVGRSARGIAIRNKIAKWTNTENGDIPNLWVPDEKHADRITQAQEEMERERCRIIGGKGVARGNELPWGSGHKSQL